jgi:hypothetical protein
MITLQQPPGTPAERKSGPILVTGPWRSGTTWVGRMTAQAPGIKYIHEPFSKFNQHGYGIKLDEQFVYITDEEKELFYPSIKRVLEFLPRFGRININYLQLEALEKKKAHQWLLYWLLHSLFKVNQTIQTVRGVRPLVKDPNALMSAPWLNKTFDMNTIVMVRHPAAFVSSMKRLNWGFDFNYFSHQKKLMRHLLADYNFEIDTFSQVGHLPFTIDGSILLWNIFHSVILKYRETYKNWLFLRHEDVAKDSMKQFKMIYRYLNLPYTARAKQIIQAFSGDHNKAEPDNMDVFDVRRNSRQSIKNWKLRLTHKEITRIYDDTKDIAAHFYNDSDW